MKNGSQQPASANDSEPTTADTLPGGQGKAKAPERPAAKEKPAPQEPPATPKPPEEPAAPEKPAAEEEKPAAQPPKDEPKEPPKEPDWKDLYARLLADFDNFKKRTARDREDTYRYAEADILKDILPAVDNLALALSNTKNDKDPFVKGVWLVYDTFISALKEHGAEPFDSVGKPLDTETMEAIAQIPSETVAEGLVSNEVKRGWMLKGKVLRAAQVVVSSGPLEKQEDKPKEAAGQEAKNG